MTSKDLTYQDIVKLRKEIEKKGKGNFYEHPIVITYGQAMHIESECLALEQENEKLKKAIEILKKVSDFEDFECGYKEYCNRYGNELTQQEYEIINEVLGE